MTRERNATLTTWLLTNAYDPNGTPFVGNLIGGDGAPKLKFMFTVEFGFRGGALAHKGSRDLQVIRYDLKTASRPNISINQEDVNYYNYRTKVATRTSFGTIKLVFYEDSFNTANDLLWNYMSKLSPITNIGLGLENSSMLASGLSTAGEEVSFGSQASGVGPLDNTDGMISWMKVHHHYIEYGATRSREDGGLGPARGKVTTYTYLNPKIESIEMDDLDMSGGEASTVGVTFTVDSVSVEHNDYA